MQLRRRELKPTPSTILSQPVRLCGDLHDQFDFEWGLAGKLGGADGDTGMLAGFAENGNEQIGGPVKDLGLVGETGS